MTWSLLLRLAMPALLLGCVAACGDANGGSSSQALSPEGLPYCPDAPEARTTLCVDAAGAKICPRDTGWPGDGVALCDPAPEEGMVLHYGPTEWDNNDAVQPFLLAPHKDSENCTVVQTPGTADRYVGAFHGRARPGAYHVILTTVSPSVSPTDQPAPCSRSDATGSRWLVGAEAPQFDITVGAAGGGPPAEPGDPDYHLAERMAAHSSVRFDVRYVNASEETIVREAWVGFDFMPEGEVDEVVDMLSLFQGDIRLPAKTQVTTARGTCEAQTPRYINLLTGHIGQTGTRVSVWKKDRQGAESLVYETFDWRDPGNLYYRDGVSNPAPDAEAGTLGGASGFLHLDAGEALSFECEYNNFRDYPVVWGTRSTDELCNVFGMFYPAGGGPWTCSCVGTSCF